MSNADRITHTYEVYVHETTAVTYEVRAASRDEAVALVNNDCAEPINRHYVGMTVDTVEKKDNA